MRYNHTKQGPVLSGKGSDMARENAGTGYRRKNMLDIRFVRENPDVVKQNIRNKFQEAKLPPPRRRRTTSAPAATSFPSRSVSLWARGRRRRQRK